MGQERRTAVRWTPPGASIGSQGGLLWPRAALRASPPGAPCSPADKQRLASALGIRELRRGGRGGAYRDEELFEL